MKRMLKILLAMAFLTTPTWGQITGDTTKSVQPVLSDTSATNAEKKSPADTAFTKADQSKPPQEKFRDENGNGIDDRLEMKGKGRGRGRDKFVDGDGDGICDGREAGLGFQRGGSGSIKSGDDAAGRGKQKQQRGKP
ncbi:hypothetical protein L0337_25820 [candidate division KSB1 bacterium]|nr:hypothetical protein [candidate division KSB1 bacterium]